MTERAKIYAINEKGQRIGEGHPRAVLTDHEVDLLLELRAECDALGRPKYSLAWLAAKFDVHKQTVAKIVAGHRRAQIPVAFRRTRASGPR